ncbi:ABC transporter ATP-binding protein [Vagococcus fluvialis]|uniref:ABC transporter ATP-binding protein n=1 Tax=Vagococcus fluvialis TaxID=2738 RepID=UPI0037CF373F
MSETILKLEEGYKKTEAGMVIMNHLNLEVKKGDFITILGGNGAGKSTLFNSISGKLQLTSGHVFINNKNVTNLSEEKRADYLSRVFQDPKQGTAPRMTVSENLLLASLRGEKRRFSLRKLKENRDVFYKLCQRIGNGLENHLDTPSGNLSGGQRQALSLLMSTIKQPEILLLDEHTAALDPKTATQIMSLTEKIVAENQLTCLMITHRMEDALKYGNRMIVLEQGQVKYDINKEEKEKLEMSDLLSFFN